MASPAQTVIGRYMFNQEGSQFEARFYEDEPGDLSTLKADICHTGTETPEKPVYTLEAHSIRIVTYNGRAPMGKHSYVPFHSIQTAELGRQIITSRQQTPNFKVQLCPDFPFEDGVRKPALLVRDISGVHDRGFVGSYLHLVNSTAFPGTKPA